MLWEVLQGNTGKTGARTNHDFARISHYGSLAWPSTPAGSGSIVEMNTGAVDGLGYVALKDLPKHAIAADDVDGYRTA